MEHGEEILVQLWEARQQIVPFPALKLEELQEGHWLIQGWNLSNQMWIPELMSSVPSKSMESKFTHGKGSDKSNLGYDHVKDQVLVIDFYILDTADSHILVAET